MSRRNCAVDVALVLALGVGLVIAFGTPTPSQAGAASLPGLSLDKTVVTPGSTVTVEGAHWPKFRELQASVCGGGLFSVSSDCDLAHAVSFGPADNGVVQTSLVVTIPPVPCPCVVMVTQPYPSEVERLPITIVGSATRRSKAVLERSILRVSNVRVVSTSSWTSWFGAASSRQLIVSVHNGGSTAIQPLLVARWVQGSDRFVITSPRSAACSPRGGAHGITAPFDLTTFSDGTFPVVGKVSGTGFEVSLASSTSTTPWALYTLGLLAAVAILLALAVMIGGLSHRDDRDQNDHVTPNPKDNDASLELSQLGHPNDPPLRRPLGGGSRRADVRNSAHGVWQQSL